MTEANKHIVESLFESGCVSVPQGTTATNDRGKTFPVLYLIQEWIDLYAVSGSIDYTPSNFRPMSFFDRVKGNSGMHLRRQERVRVAVLDGGKIRVVNASSVSISSPCLDRAITE